MTDNDERREPAADERCQRELDKLVVAIVLEENLVVFGVTELMKCPALDSERRFADHRDVRVVELDP